MVRQWSPPYNRPKILHALKRYGQRGGGVISVRRRRIGGTITGLKGEYNPLSLTGYNPHRSYNPFRPYKRRLAPKRRRRTR